MTAVDKCSLPHRDNLMQPIHMQLSQKLNNFCSFISHFRNLSKTLDIFQKKITLIAYFFLRLRPAKSVVRSMCKSPASDYYSRGNRVNGFQLFQISSAAPVANLLINGKTIELQKVSFSDMR